MCVKVVGNKDRRILRVNVILDQLILDTIYQQSVIILTTNHKKEPGIGSFAIESNPIDPPLW